MQTDDEEYIAYRPDKYTQTSNNPKVEDEDEFAYEKALHNFKWNQFMNEYDSLASDISFKRVKRDGEDAPADSAPPQPAEGGEAGGGETGGGGESGGSAGGGDTAGKVADDGKEIKLYLTPIIGLTAFFALLFIVGPFLVRKGPNRGIVQCSIMLSAFCMWIFWVTVYIGQMNPLMGPRLENTTVAWMSVKVGNAIKPPPPLPAGVGE